MINDRSVRLSQTLAPFGVGAIYDFVGESLVACDTALWKGHGTRLRLRRLEEQLNVAGFRAAPSQASLFGSSGPKVPYARFPQWLFCPRCRRMSFWGRRDEVEGEPPRCRMNNCPGNAQLVPMRFIAICEDGHMDEAPWQLWAHLKSENPDQRQCRSKDLSFLTRPGAGTGLSSLQLRCNTCHASNNLGQLSSTDSLKPYNVSCSGRQPWQRFEAAESCLHVPQVVQRGATNVYFARTASALDIPPESDYASFNDLAVEVTNTPEFAVIVSNPSGPMAVFGIEELARRFETSEERIREIVDAHVAEAKGDHVSLRGRSEHDLAAEEWLAFHSGEQESDHRDRFITRTVDFVEGLVADSALDRLSQVIGRVVVATRLREVRALVGFSRLRPDCALLDPGLGRVNDWLPAIEVFGEGIFLSFDEGAVARWERNHGVLARASDLEQRRESSLFGPRLGAPSTPRFLLLHTLAHLLIRQLAFDCGYSASSLRERIYARTPEHGAPQAGILIYTAAGDVEGTLGGLVRQGEPPRLQRTLLRALQNAAWCSSDPLCRESSGQGFNALNLAACHACSLVSETSCAYANVLLDRGMVVDSELVEGFFSAVLEAAIAESVAAGRAAL